MTMTKKKKEKEICLDYSQIKTILEEDREGGICPSARALIDEIDDEYDTDIDTEPELEPKKKYKKEKAKAKAKNREGKIARFLKEWF